MTFLPPAWYAILDFTELPRPGRVRRVRRFSMDLVLWRTTDGVALLEDRCPLGGTRLSRGALVTDGIRCRCHGFVFDYRGVCVDAPNPRWASSDVNEPGTRSFTTRVEHGLLWLWWPDHEPAAELPYFESIAGATKLATPATTHFPASFMRVMESHFDLYHVDHLHSWPLRLGHRITESRTEVEGPYIRCENRYRDPRSGKTRITRATVLFPALSLQVGDDEGAFRILAAAAPIDERTTWFFMRHYFAPFHLPVLGPALNALNNLNSVYRVLKEDAWVQSRQQPAASGMGADQLILPADRGVIEYWRMWRRAVEDVQPAPSVAPDASGPNVQSASAS